MKSVPSIAVLLAAYNGREWIEEQLRSILAQKDVRVQIYISVDLSTDDTYAWCHAFSNKDSRVSVLPLAGRFGGAAKNFFRLIRDVDFSNFDYIALADQDDVWLEDKLISAHIKIADKNAMGYSANVIAFWPNGRQKIVRKAQQQKRFDYLFEAAGPGCSYVIKVSSMLKFKDFIVQNRLCADNIGLHDWLIYAWHRANELPWHIDPEPKVLYRQHAENQVGANSGIQGAISRLKLLRSGWYRAEVSKIVRVLEPHLVDVPKSLGVDGRIPLWFLLLQGNNFRRRFRDRLLLAFLILVGIY
jgi:rhamnosyltransferase